MVKPPKKIADYPEQLRPPIAKSEGSTPSERYLARLADDTFLNLWSYPNPYRSQKLGGAGDGKELCDLMVVCDPHVILFSEKDITWTNKPIEVAWPRWFRKAVDASATQLRGAERWIGVSVYLTSICPQIKSKGGFRAKESIGQASRRNDLVRIIRMIVGVETSK